MLDLEAKANQPAIFRPPASQSASKTEIEHPRSRYPDGRLTRDYGPFCLISVFGDRSWIFFFGLENHLSIDRSCFDHKDGVFGVYGASLLLLWSHSRAAVARCAAWNLRNTSWQLATLVCAGIARWFSVCGALIGADMVEVVHRPGPPTVSPVRLSLLPSLPKLIDTNMPRLGIDSPRHPRRRRRRHHHLRISMTVRPKSGGRARFFPHHRATVVPRVPPARPILMARAAQKGQLPR